MKRFFLITLFLIGLFFPLLGISAQNNNQTLSVYNYSTYIDPEVIKEFENKFGVKVTYDTYENSEELYAKLKPGNPGYDVVFPTDYMVTIMIKENLLEPLNLDKIPNIKHLDDKFVNPPFDPGNKYSLPYQWGTLGLGYNLKDTGEEIKSWSAIFDPKYQGKIALMEEARSMLGGILIYLGYDPNTINPEEIAAAKELLLEHRENIVAFAPDNGQLLLDQGEVAIAVEWSGDILQVMEENPDLRYSIPEEGSVVWIDNVAIAKDAPNKELAEQFINFLLEPEISAKISNFIRYASPNKTAIETGLINPEQLNNPAIYPPPEIYEKLTYLKDVGEATQLYDEAWTELKIGVGI